MSPQEILDYERRLRMRYAAVAVAAGVCIVVAAILQIAGPQPKVNEVTVQLIATHTRFPLDVIGSIVNAFGLVALALAMSFLAVCTRHRRPATSPAARIATLVGAVLGAITAVVYTIVISVKADQFVTTGSQTFEEAHALTKSTVVVAAPFVSQLSALLLAMGIFFIALNAMRVGLLTRFMGYLGLFVGVLQIFPIGILAFGVQASWLVALGVLFADRWPNGEPKAWTTGRSEAWPTAAEQREQREQRAAAGGGRQRPAARGAAQATVPDAPPAPKARTRAETPKRKRKRRR